MDLNKGNWQKNTLGPVCLKYKLSLWALPVYVPVLGCHFGLFSHLLLLRMVAEKQPTKNVWSREWEWQGKSLRAQRQPLTWGSISLAPPRTHANAHSHTQHTRSVFSVFFLQIYKIKAQPESFHEFSTVHRERNQILFSPHSQSLS